jgi:hypothetical protein
MDREIQEQVADILSRHDIANDKIRLLEELRTDLRAQQRAATESSMAGSDGFEDNLQLIDIALEKLHATDVVDADEKNAATL